METSIEKHRLQCGGAIAEVVPGRGGLVSRFAVGEDEVLFLDEATLKDPEKNVRGGVPLLFPFAGKPPAGSTLAQHGFARRRPWTVVGTTPRTLDCVLRDDEATRAAWPFSFEVRERVVLRETALHLEWTFHNRGATPMPLHFGLHPYFRAGADKAAVRVDGASGEAFDNRAGTTVKVERVDFSAGEVDLHFASRARGTVLHRGEAGPPLRLSWSSHFEVLVVWTLPGQPFVCVEPWTARGQHPARGEVAPGASELLWVEVSLAAEPAPTHDAQASGEG
jgi:galactose mutarotase-like enzyme